VFHLTKYKALAAIDRQQITPNVDRSRSDFNEEFLRTLRAQIDPSKTDLQEEFATTHLALPKAVERRLAAGSKRKPFAMMRSKH